MDSGRALVPARRWADRLHRTGERLVAEAKQTLRERLSVRVDEDVDKPAQRETRQEAPEWHAEHSTGDNGGHAEPWRYSAQADSGSLIACPLSSSAAIVSPRGR